ncbi:putative glutathione S-transferase [Ilyonectria robusta]
MANSEPVHFFDVLSSLEGPSKSWSPNTLHIRLILNYKRIPYTQSFISYPDIAPLLKSLSVPANETGFPYTLPTINHKPSITVNSSGTLTDSLQIALHLDKTFPSPPLFPHGDASYALAIAVSEILNNVASHIYLLGVSKCPEILDERGRAYFVKSRSEIFGKPFHEIRPQDEEKVKEMEAAALKELEGLVRVLKGREEKQGVFFEGENPGNADFLVVSLFAWIERVDKVLWNKLINVGEGELRALWDACLPWLDGQGEEKEWQVGV